MAASLWPLYRLTLIITSLWMFLVVLALIEECQGSCAFYINQYEKKHHIPPGLLQAISKVESGRKDPTGRVVSWPWTVNAEGQGYFYKTKEDAIAAVEKMQQQGISSIDVGCMQVNLYHHPDAFKDLEDAFDPHKNVAYAAHFLKKLKITHESWHQAVAHYHSANPIHHIPYRQHVMNAWNKGLNKGALSLATATTSQRLHRLRPGKRLSLTRAAYTPDSYTQPTVRRVVSKTSPHIHRLTDTRKTLKL